MFECGKVTCSGTESVAISSSRNYVWRGGNPQGFFLILLRPCNDCSTFTKVALDYQNDDWDDVGGSEMNCSCGCAQLQTIVLIKVLLVPTRFGIGMRVRIEVRWRYESRNWYGG